MKKRHWAILIALAFLAGGLLWVLLIREPVEEGRCRMVRKKADINSQLMGLAIRFVEPMADKPEAVRDLPAGFSRPAYYQFKSGDRLVLMAMDYSEELRLCVDTDGDGVLSEERCFTAGPVEESRTSGRSQRFGPIPSLSSDGTAKAGDGFYVKCYRADAPAALTVYSASYRTGRLLLDGHPHRVAVVDGDYDGGFRSILSLPLERQWRMPDSDVFAIDLNHNGKFEISLYDRSEVVPLGTLVKVADNYYAIDIAPDGMSLALSKTEPPFGTLAVEPNDIDMELRLWSDAADQHLLFKREQQLPAGKYKAIYAVMRKADASGDAWVFSSSLDSAFTRLGPFEFFTIQQGETTSIKIGPPFVVKADVRMLSSGSVSISPAVIGCAGEVYSAAYRQNQGRPSPIPFKIVDEKGTVLVADKFQYG
ncbi:MAG: hypothetical protein ABFE01_06985 [Phycisphaerales bacterium]